MTDPKRLTAQDFAAGVAAASSTHQILYRRADQMFLELGALRMLTWLIANGFIASDVATDQILRHNQDGAT